MDADATLTVDLATLPDEPAVLKQLVVQLFDELQKAKAALHANAPTQDTGYNTTASFATYARRGGALVWLT